MHCALCLHCLFYYLFRLIFFTHWHIPGVIAACHLGNRVVADGLRGNRWYPMYPSWLYTCTPTYTGVRIPPGGQWSTCHCLLLPRLPSGKMHIQVNATQALFQCWSNVSAGGPALKQHLWQSTVLCAVCMIVEQRWVLWCHTYDVPLLCTTLHNSCQTSQQAVQTTGVWDTR